ncbi:uncharacterized protein PAC_14308 [Phialocephala subalpina]|uniref:Uncharacterized protein n=1 Tax=Phialocephala subalpina TaxID=576137 RepID=A0A1L7XH99_9HELO|nr:uncharacterized protein PAC_14308 [Phialocephala subalpina]
MASEPPQPALKAAQPDAKPTSVTTVEATHDIREKGGKRRSFVPKNTTVYFSICFATVPLLLIACILIGMVYSNLGNAQGDSVLPELQLPSDTVDSSAYLVDFSATQLTTLASWASSIATLLPGVLVGLCGYRVAREMMQHSEDSNTNRLPTPYQLSLLLGTYTGGLLTVWNWISYLLWKRRQNVIPVFTFTLVVFVSSSVLAYLIWAADTWFHVTTSTGFGIVPSCEGFFNSTPGAQWFNCSNDSFLNGARVNSGYALMANIDPTRTLITVPSNESFPEVSFVTGSRRMTRTDYIATTFGFSTSCKLTTNECNMRYYDNVNNGAWMYNCTAAFSDVLAADSKYNEWTSPCRSYGTGCYGLYQNNSFLGDVPANGNDHVNPFAVGVSAQVVGLAEQLTWSSEIISADDFSNFVLACQVNVSDIKYSVINGSTTILSSTPSNDTVAFLSTGWDSLSVGTPAIQNAIVVAATTATTSTDELVTSFTSSLGKIFAAFSSDSFVEVPNVLQQFRETILVARVPKAPFYTLPILCFLMSLLGLLLGIVTLTSSPSVARDVHTRLSVAGVVAAHFEDAEQVGSKVSSMKDMFAENEGRRRNIRVGVGESDQGGWVFRIFDGGDQALLSGDAEREAV